VKKTDFSKKDGVDRSISMKNAGGEGHVVMLNAGVANGTSAGSMRKWGDRALGVIKTN